MKKKCVCILVLLLLCLVSVPAVNAEGGVSGSVSSVTVYPGETVALTVSVNSNSGCAFISSTPTYDSSVLTYNGAVNGNVIGTLTSGRNLVWSNAGNVTATGTLVTLNFTVSKSAAPGSYSVGLSVNQALNDQQEDISASFSSGSITVKKKPVYATGIDISNTSVSFKKAGETFTLTAKVSNKDADNQGVSFSSNNTAVASVDAKTGVIKAIANGTATITVKSNDGYATASCTVKVDIPHEHNYATLKNDSANHWYQCSCGDKNDLEAHKYGDCVIKEATEESDGSKTWTCKVCGYTKTEVIPMIVHEHDFEAFEGIEATCTEAGRIAYKVCKSCGYYYDENDQMIDAGDVDIPAKGHHLIRVKATEPTHTETGLKLHYVCSECGQLFTDLFATEPCTEDDVTIQPAEHVWGKYEFNENGHCQHCYCGAESELETHDLVEYVVTDENGKRTENGMICRICGYSYQTELKPEETQPITDDEPAVTDPEPKESENDFMDIIKDYAIWVAGVLLLIVIAENIYFVILIMKVKKRRIKRKGNM